jgi:hypothetical protein
VEAVALATLISVVMVVLVVAVVVPSAQLLAVLV